MSMQVCYCRMVIRVITNMNFHGRDSARSLLIGQTILLFGFIIIVPIFINITLQGQICNAVTETPTTKCDYSFNYTESSTFESNLQRVFDSLVEGANRTGFNISMYGQSPDRIYGLFQCREDMTVDQCYICSQLAITSIRQSCGNTVGASVWPFHCFLRYANSSFIRTLDTDLGSNFSPGFGGDAGVFIPTDFLASAQNLLKNLSGEAPAKTKRSAYGTALDSLYQTIYGLVQCTRDLSPGDCSTCLSYSVNKIFTSAPTAGAQYWSQSCILRYEIYPFYNSTVLPPPPPAPPAEGPANSTEIKSSQKRTHIILGVVGGLVLLLIVCICATRRRLKAAIFGRGYQDDEEERKLLSHDRQMVFTLETLLIATQHFHEDNKLGEGGFGPVYKGTTPDGKEIAVKKLSFKSMQGRKEFLNEVKLVAKIQHRNLVNLLGCCAEGSERLLVYEYLPNKSLDQILFDTDPNRRNQLSWGKRYKIIMGVARGLLYLHQDSQLRIIHRDIKASNVLLDKKLNPKIADFGLARLFPEDQTHVSTRVAGTYGYMPPEYAMQGQLSAKTDVYSFGILLLELVTGRKNTDYNLPPEMQILLGWVWRSYDAGNLVQVIDPAIIETCNESEALRCIQVGLLCTQAESQLRPPMSTVTLMLSSESVTYLPDPTKPAFVESYVSQITKSTNSQLSHASAAPSSASSSHTPVSVASNATASITDLVPR